MSGSAAWAVLWFATALGSIACGLVLLRRSEHASLMKLLVGAWLVVLGIAAAVVLTILLAFPPR
ncbi:MAG: hypothetical protein ACYC5Q_15875 [Thermoleophilia bacterium]